MKNNIKPKKKKGDLLTIKAGKSKRWTSFIRIIAAKPQNVYLTNNGQIERASPHKHENKGVSYEARKNIYSRNISDHTNHIILTFYRSLLQKSRK